MALALHQRTGFPIYAVLHHIPPEEGEDYPDLAHAFVVTPDGLALDANGKAPISEMGEIGRVWEAHIGSDKHPETGEKGQWWISTVDPLTVERLCEIREACNDVLDPKLLTKANKWIDKKGLLGT
jgi:hypothetical protein